MEEKKLPEGWAWTAIGKIATTTSGGTPSRKYPEYFGGSIPWVKSGELNDRIISGSEETLSPDGLSNSSAKIFPSGTVLIAMYGATIGKTGILGINAATNQAICAIFPSKGVFIPKYTIYWLQSKRQMLIESGFGGAQHNINQAVINNLPLPLAPLPEQQRIVEAIEQQFSRLDAGVALLRQAQKRLKLYRASVLKAAVEGELTANWRAAHPNLEPASELLQHILAERRAKWEGEQVAKGRDPGKAKYEEPAGPDVNGLPELPEGWCWATVGQVITNLRNGLPQKPNTKPPGYRILRINAVRPMKVNLDEVRYLSLSESDVQGYFIENGDILFTRYNGSLDLLGVAGMVKNCSEPTLHPDKLIRAKTVINEVLPAFLETACNVGASRAFIASRARTTAGQTGVSGSDIKQTPLPLPPLTEQAQIVALVEERLSIIGELESTIEKALKRAERQRQSILHQAFSGRLVAQNPEDEPASVLLERIRREREQTRPDLRASSAKPGASTSRKQASAAQTSWLPGGPVEAIDSAGVAQESLWQEAMEAENAAIQ